MFQRAGRAGWYYTVDATERNVSLGTTDHDEARRRFAAVLERCRVRELAPGARPLAEIFAETRKRAESANTPKTVYELHLNLTRVLAWLEQRGVTMTAHVSKQVVEDYKSERRFRVSAARINRELDSWRRALRVAVELGAIAAEAPGWLVKLREPRPEPHQVGYTRAELQRFLRALPDAYRPLFRVALGTGMRDDEIRHMEASDVRPGWIVVTPKPGWSTKGYRYRKIPVTPATTKAARELLAVRDRLNLDQKRVWTVAARACEAAGIKRLSLHDLRRAWASHTLAAGARIEDLSRWLGHADVLTTMRYLRVVDDRHPGRGKLAW